MPHKKIRKPKTREYLENLLDNVGLTDRELAQAIKNGIESENATERAKALEMAGQWKGFAEVDKKAGDEIEHLPLANISKAELDRLANRCSYCKHKQFEPLNTGKAKPTQEPIMGPKPTEPVGGPEVGMSVPDSMLPKVGEPYGGEAADTGNPGSDEVIPAIPVDTEPIKETNEQTPQEKTD